MTVGAAMRKAREPNDKLDRATDRTIRSIYHTRTMYVFAEFKFLLFSTCRLPKPRRTYTRYRKSEQIKLFLLLFVCFCHYYGE